MCVLVTHPEFNFKIKCEDSSFGLLGDLMEAKNRFIKTFVELHRLGLGKFKI